MRRSLGEDSTTACDLTLTLFADCRPCTAQCLEILHDAGLPLRRSSTLKHGPVVTADWGAPRSDLETAE